MPVHTLPVLGFVIGRDRATERGRHADRVGIVLLPIGLVLCYC